MRSESWKWVQARFSQGDLWEVKASVVDGTTKLESAQMTFGKSRLLVSTGPPSARSPVREVQGGGVKQRQ